MLKKMKGLKVMRSLTHDSKYKLVSTGLIIAGAYIVSQGLYMKGYNAGLKDSK